jgi:hypothetical protein
MTGNDPYITAESLINELGSKDAVGISIIKRFM